MPDAHKSSNALGHFFLGSNVRITATRVPPYLGASVQFKVEPNVRLIRCL